MRIIAFTKYGDMAASSRQRLLQYIPYLAAHGISVDIFPLLENEHMRRLLSGRRSNLSRTAAAYFRRFLRLFSAHRYDLVWVHYELFPYFPGLFERLVKLAGRPVVVDYDDATFHLYDRHRNGLVRRFLGNKLERLLRSASAVACGNAYIQHYVEAYCANTMIIPTVVDTTAYVPGERIERDRLVVGWIGSPSTWLFVKPLLPTLLPFLAERGATLRVVGAGADAQGIEGVESVEWSEQTEIAEVQAMDIGIMPLPDDDWARGKCGYKLIQYMACGLPVVASPVGVNAEIVREGETGFLADDEASWLRALGVLLSDSALRARMGALGRQRAERAYSLQSQQPRLLALLDSAAAAGLSDRA